MMPDKGTILYVEDNADNRNLIRRVLTAEGFSMVEAANALQALDRLKEVKTDLILMDINMPDMDGYTLTAKIKSMPNFMNIPIIAVTANVMRGDREKSLEAGCDGYIQKPIDIDSLAQQIERFIRRRTNVSNFVLIARMLGYLGIHCEWKTSGYEVVEYADTLPRLDLILMDIRLPYEDGYGALKKIRASERFKAVPIVAVTAEASLEQMNKAAIQDSTVF